MRNLGGIFVCCPATIQENNTNAGLKSRSTFSKPMFSQDDTAGSRTPRNTKSNNEGTEEDLSTEERTPFQENLM